MQDNVAKALGALRQRDFAAARDFIVAFSNDNVLELQHYMIKGLSEIGLAEWKAARETFEVAVGYFPHQAQLWMNLGLAQENLGQIDEAAESFEEALHLSPDEASIHGNLSNIYRRQGRLQDAEIMAHRAFELGAPKSQALNVLGLALAKQGRHDAAEKVYREALQLEPNNGDIKANLATLAVDRLDFATAWPLYAAARATADKPTIRREEGLARLLSGDYAEGWRLYESRLELPRALRVMPTCPRYKGEELVGKKLVVVAEQGLGDTIQFCRYGELLANRGAELTWMVSAALQKIMTGNVTGKIMADTEPMPEADFYVPMLSLPLATQRPSFMEAPSVEPWHVGTEPQLPEVKAGTRRIGLVWAGSPTHERDHERSIPLELFAPFLTTVKADFYAPFVGGALEEIGALPIKRLDAQLTDFAATAAILRQLDCVVTVDTSVAHLAGTLGVKTYLLLPHCPDWRWGVSGETTPWYPSVTLLRQPTYGDWVSVIDKLITMLIVAH